MDELTATDRMAAMAQTSRMAALRLLIKAGPEGLPAGEIARALEIPHNTLSTHLAILGNVDLLQSRREGRRIIYSVNFAALRELLVFLLEDCCGGSPQASNTAASRRCSPAWISSSESGSVCVSPYAGRADGDSSFGVVLRRSDNFRPRAETRSEVAA